MVESLSFKVFWIDWLPPMALHMGLQCILGRIWAEAYRASKATITWKRKYMLNKLLTILKSRISYQAFLIWVFWDCSKVKLLMQILCFACWWSGVDDWLFEMLSNTRLFIAAGGGISLWKEFTSTSFIKSWWNYDEEMVNPKNEWWFERLVYIDWNLW